MMSRQFIIKLTFWLLHNKTMLLMLLKDVDLSDVERIRHIWVVLCGVLCSFKHSTITWCCKEARMKTHLQSLCKLACQLMYIVPSEVQENKHGRMWTNNHFDDTKRVLSGYSGDHSQPPKCRTAALKPYQPSLQFFIYLFIFTSGAPSTDAKKINKK